MSNPLAPYFNRIPGAEELAKVPLWELIRIAEAAESTETLDVTDLEETRRWATNLREAVLAAIKEKTAQ